MENPLIFEVNDLDWTMGELAHLFSQANRIGTLPHELNPNLFHSAWSVLNHQPPEIAEQCRNILISILTAPLWRVSQSGGITRNLYPAKLISLKCYENPILS